jgi:hypothetical protein
VTRSGPSDPIGEAEPVAGDRPQVLAEDLSQEGGEPDRLGRVRLRRADDGPAADLGHSLADPHSTTERVDSLDAKSSGFSEAETRPSEQERQHAVALAGHGFRQTLELVGPKEALLRVGKAGE